MRTIGKFKIKYSFWITSRRGFVIVGNPLEGTVRIGCIVTFNTGFEYITHKIIGIERGRSSTEGEVIYGLTLLCKDEEERKKFETLKLPEHIVEIIEEGTFS